MESKAKVLGHPIHQMLIVLPLGLLTAAVLFDIIYYVTGRASLTTVSYWNIAAGIVSGLVAAVFGFIDWSKIPKNTRAHHIGMLHGGGNVVVLALFAASWMFRSNQPAYVPTLGAFMFELIALSIGGVTGWLGGELVDRLGVGVHEGANLNAPSSLSGKPAYARVNSSGMP